MELHLGKSWRAHEDLDIGICREDLKATVEWLAGWDFQTATNNVWARRTFDEAWALDLTVGEGDAEQWVYRRDPAVSRPWEQAVLHTAEGIPYLAPDLQLLFKGKDVRPKDQVDAEMVIPELTSAQLGFLFLLLPKRHPWLEFPDCSGLP